MLHMHMSLKIIRLNSHLPFILILLNIFKHMYLITFGVYSNPHLNTVQLTVFEVLMFHENTELIAPSNSSDLYPGNNDPT